MDLDVHADNTVLGDCCVLIHDIGRKVDVSGFSTALGSIELPIVSGAVAYDHPITGKDYILVFHQAIYCRQMDNHLICPMQCRVNGVVINNTPKMCIPNPDDSTHSIEVADPLDQQQQNFKYEELGCPLCPRYVRTCSILYFGAQRFDRSRESLPDRLYIFSPSHYHHHHGY